MSKLLMFVAAVALACAPVQAPPINLAEVEHIQRCTYSGCDRVVICTGGRWVSCSAGHRFQCPSGR